jgi:heme/copper-type cytochrome/quinol oxidase subunit 2
MVPRSLLLALLSILACGEGSSPTRPTNGLIEMTASQWRFAPKRIALEVGEAATLRITSLDRMYTFTIDELDIHVEIDSQQTVNVQLRLSQVGDFTFYSALEGHRAQGMEGRLSVTRRPVVPSAGVGGGSYGY